MITALNRVFFSLNLINMVARKNKMTRKILSEILGTAILTLFTSGIAIMVQASTFNTGGFFITALSSTLVMYVLQELLYDKSGAHFNPVVSLVELLEKRIKVGEFFASLFGQLIGVAIGTLFIWVFSNDSSTISYGCTTYVQGDVAKTIMFAVLAVSIFTWTVLSAYGKENRSLLISTAFGVSNLLSMVLTGGGNIDPFRTASMNLLYMVTASDFSGLVILPVLVGAPILGGIFGWVLYSMLLSTDSEKPKKQKREKKKEKKKEEKIESDDEGTFLDEFGNEWILENGIPKEKGSIKDEV